MNPNDPGGSDGADLTPQQKKRYRRKLRELPQGREFNNWVAQQIANRLEKPILWQYSDVNTQTQQRTNRIEILDGETEEVLGVIEPNRQEAARSLATGLDWVGNIVAVLDSSDDNVSTMHDKLEDDLSSKYEEMMNKLKGDSDE